MIEVELLGGPLNGKKVAVNSFQPYVYKTLPLSVKQYEALNISGSIAWKPPEAVYEKASKTEFRYKHTVHYKPRHEGQIEIWDSKENVSHAPNRGATGRLTRALRKPADTQ
jgi:hypothetical protein